MQMHSSKAFTLLELMIAGSIAVVAIGLTANILLYTTRIMYKDTQRLETNSILRSATEKIAVETMDATEVYVFPSYQSIDTAVDITTDVSAVDATNPLEYYGDCLVAVTRVSDVNLSSNIRYFRIFYRIVTATGNPGELWMYKSTDYGTTGTTSSISTLLTAVNLNASPRPALGMRLALNVYGKPRPTSGTYPIFSTNANLVTSSPQYVSVNMEVANGTNINTRLSSSSFNYTISPRK